MTEPNEETQQGSMPFREHLTELRGRMLRATIAIALGFFVAWSFHVELYEWLSGPVRSAMADNGLFAIKALQITESISVYVKLSLVGGIFIASPFIFYQVWAFVAPGMLRTERRMIIPVVAASVVFFAAGAAFCYSVVLPFMTDFLIKLTVEAQGMSLEPTLQSTVAYSMWLLLAFGLVFELPVFMYFLSVMGLVTASGLLGFYRYWVVIAFVVGAILTPTPDPLNQMLMSGPLVVLYGLGTAVAWLVERDRSQGNLIPLRGALVLLALLGVAGWYASNNLFGRGHRQPIEDVPRDVTQLVGVHRGAVDRIRQQSTGSHGDGALGVLALLDSLDAGKLDGTTIWLARFPDGVALIARHPNADSVPLKVAGVHNVSQTTYAGGPSALFSLPGDRSHWRIAAPQPDVIWLGNDAALARLAKVRSGDAPALVEDMRITELLEPLRASGPLFAVTLAQSGRTGWLPQGALAETVDLVTASLQKDGKRLRITYRCQGEDNARSLRDRLQIWTAEQRDTLTKPRRGTAELREISSRLGKVAGALARVADATARMMPDGSPDQISSLKASHDAMLIARELRGFSPGSKDAPSGPLARLIAPPAVSDTEARVAEVTWTVEATSDRLIDALFAPTGAGFKTALLQPKGGKKPGNKAKKSGNSPASDKAAGPKATSQRADGRANDKGASKGEGPAKRRLGQPRGVPAAAAIPTLPAMLAPPSARAAGGPP
ncbi:MAG: twin-arginine translocase subunit TatC [Myxococcales bacterium]|nr:twin-arginine translocase subunit TatC [Myxococcales bacterium]